MREKIAEWLYYYKYGRLCLWKDLANCSKEQFLIDADQILKEVCEEIEKVRKNNPYPEKPSLASAEYYEANGYDRACRKILSLFTGI